MANLFFWISVLAIQGQASMLKFILCFSFLFLKHNLLSYLQWYSFDRRSNFFRAWVNPQWHILFISPILPTLSIALLMWPCSHHLSFSVFSVGWTKVRDKSKTRLQCLKLNKMSVHTHEYWTIFNLNLRADNHHHTVVGRTLFLITTPDMALWKNVRTLAYIRWRTVTP